jgi:hypothetical protein
MRKEIGFFPQEKPLTVKMEMTAEFLPFSVQGRNPDRRIVLDREGWEQNGWQNVPIVPHYPNCPPGGKRTHTLPLICLFLRSIQTNNGKHFPASTTITDEQRKSRGILWFHSFDGWGRLLPAPKPDHQARRQRFIVGESHWQGQERENISYLVCNCDWRLLVEPLDCSAFSSK